jgi:hypothetical protein
VSSPAISRGTTVIEAADSTTLDQVANTYSLYAHGTTAGPQLKISGAAVTVGQFGAWAPIGAEQVAGGYQVAWRFGATDQYVVWNTDSSGNFLSQSAVVSGSSPTVRSLESGQPRPQWKRRHWFRHVDTSFGSAAEVGPVTSGTLALLTNYMASAFAPPAAQGTGVVADPQSSLQPFLAKPIA